jgi:hypothetical protein
LNIPHKYCNDIEVKKLNAKVIGIEAIIKALIPEVRLSKALLDSSN